MNNLETNSLPSGTGFHIQGQNLIWNFDQLLSVEWLYIDSQDSLSKDQPVSMQLQALYVGYKRKKIIG